LSFCVHFFGGRSDYSFYPEEEGEGGKRSIKKTVRFTGNLCDYLADLKFSINEILLKESKQGVLTLNCK